MATMLVNEGEETWIGYGYLHDDDNPSYWCSLSRCCASGSTCNDGVFLGFVFLCCCIPWARQTIPHGLVTLSMTVRVCDSRLCARDCRCVGD